MQQQIKRVIFDLSTNPVSQAFIFAGDDNEARLRLAPRMLAASVFVEDTHEFIDFVPETAIDLIALLKRTSELVSYNGKKFDLLVLTKHHNLKSPVPTHGVHTDLGEIAQGVCRGWVLLNEMTQLNLGEPNLNMDDFRAKHGLEHDPANRIDAKAKCREDIRQTYELWKLQNKGLLRFPNRGQT